MRVIAIDWSGARTGAERRIWLAEAGSNGLLRLENGRTREQVVAWLIAQAGPKSRVVVGLDFAFSLPAWFLDELGLRDAPALWRHVAGTGETWIADCQPPFWGRAGKPRPAAQNGVRQTDLEAPAVQGLRPKSAFQVSGAGSVGAGSLRGMPCLAALALAGFSIWPFHAPSWPLAIEIYPRLLTGPVAKRNAEARRRYAAQYSGKLAPEFLRAIEQSEDAFDAAISALVMQRHSAELAALPTVSQPVYRREGLIWRPRQP